MRWLRFLWRVFRLWREFRRENMPAAEETVPEGLEPRGATPQGREPEPPEAA